ncbi:hypothetical protein LCGC14_0613870 [marine sediment metagenome]|uniref:Uncharacterized protein n=1 Tax=marine sediment metagenome TaxID=412755 RepID=A0A0F9RR57_9ZZZZ
MDKILEINTKKGVPIRFMQKEEQFGIITELYVNGNLVIDTPEDLNALIRLLKCGAY